MNPVCPKCGDAMHPELVMNALSRYDNTTYICSDCGVAEAMKQAGLPTFWKGFNVQREQGIEAAMARLDRAAGQILDRRNDSQVSLRATYRSQEDELVRASLDLLNRLRRADQP